MQHKKVEHPLFIKITGNIAFFIYLPFGLLIEFINLCKHIHKWYWKGADKVKEDLDKT